MYHLYVYLYVLFQRDSGENIFVSNVVLMSKISNFVPAVRGRRKEIFFKLLWGRGCKIRCASKNNFYNSNTSVSRCSEEEYENMEFY